MAEFFIEHLTTPVGGLRIVTDDAGRLRATDWEDFDERLQKMLRRHCGIGNGGFGAAPNGSAARARLVRYFDGDMEALDGIITATGGTEFQRLVWDALRHIPAGGTLSYGGLAAGIGKPLAVRAVGLANGANPICIAVPCHRVIGADGGLTGFAGGLARKRWLLDHERANANNFAGGFTIADRLPFSPLAVR